MFARRTPRLSRPLAARGRGGARAGGRPGRPGRRLEQQPDARHRRKVIFTVGITRRHRLGQPVHGHRGRGLRDLPDGVPDAHRVLGDGLLRRARPRRVVAGVGRQEDVDLQDPLRRDVERRRAAHRQGRGVHLQPRSSTASTSSTNFGSYVENITKAEAPDDTTLVLTVSKPSPIMEQALRLHPPAAHLGEDRREGGQELQERGHRGLADRRRRPLRDGRAQGRPVHPDAGQPQLLRRQAGGRRGRVQDLQERRRARPGAEEGRDRLRRRARGQRLQVAGGAAGHHDRLRRSTPASTSSRSTPARRSTTAPRSATATRCSRTRSCARRCGWAIDRQALVDKVLGGGGTPGLDDHPADVHRPAPRRRPTRSPTTRRRPRRCSTRPATRSGSDGVRADAQGNKLSFRLFGAQRVADDSQKSVRVRQGLLRRRRRRDQGQGRRPRTRSPRSSARATSTCSSGAGSSSPTRTTSSRRSPARTGRTRTATRSTPTCPTRSTATRRYDNLYAQQARRDRRDQAHRDRQADAADALRRRAVPRDLLLQQPRGLPVRPVHRVRPAARPERLAALPVRHVVVREHQAGHHGSSRARSSSSGSTSSGPNWLVIIGDRGPDRDRRRGRHRAAPRRNRDIDTDDRE